jgi:hypothetical protein
MFRKSSLALFIAATLTTSAFAGTVPEKYKDDSRGVQAAKDGILIPFKLTGACSAGFKKVPGQPGDDTCYQGTDGKLHCPNKCVPASTAAEK